ncbi:hypothetical protein IT575_13885 [bacterium]|nr:hypothetical protein [bacterium]
MSGLRIGIDVGGTFTHGVLLEPPGRVLASARVPTTHRASAGVAQGIGEVLALLLERLAPLGRSRDEITLVAHSTTQATNALLEGDLSGVHLLALYPPGEREAVAAALAPRLLPLGGGHYVKVWPKLLCPWESVTAEAFPAEVFPAEPVLRTADTSVRKDAVPEDAEAGLRAQGTGGSGPATTGISEAGLAGGALGSLSILPEPDWQRPGGAAEGWEGQGGIPPGFWVSPRLPVAIVQPLAGRHEMREPIAAAHYRAHGHSVVCAGEITQVLGLAARARTAIVNAAMLPTMLSTAEHTERSVRELLPDTMRQSAAGEASGSGPSPMAGSGAVALQVVRSDGGAMAISEMRRQPINALLSGPAAGASAALHLSGLSDFVFIEVGGTSTDITIVSDGRVRQRSAEVGGQRLLVPALELRTVAVGGGSMLRADGSHFGPRSAHIAGLPYLFQALEQGLSFAAPARWREAGSEQEYLVCEMSDGSQAAFTLTDMKLMLDGNPGARQILERELDGPIQAQLLSAADALGAGMTEPVSKARLIHAADFAQFANSELARETGVETAAQLTTDEQDRARLRVISARQATCQIVTDTVRELAKAQKLDLSHFQLVGGGGGAPTIAVSVGSALGLRQSLIADHTVISAIGAALAVTCVSLSRTVADPKAADIAELSEQVAERLRAQGSERVSTDYDYDPQRQVLTVTGRGNRPYEQDAQPHTDAQLAALAADLLGGSAGPGSARQSLASESRQPMAGAPEDADGSVRGPEEDGRGQAHAPTVEEGGSRPATTGGADLLWAGGGMQLWQAHSGADERYGPPGRHPVGRPGAAAGGRAGGLFGAGRGRGRGTAALALQHFGRVLWQGRLSAHYPARGAGREAVLAQVLARHTAWGDGGSELPGLALLAGGRLIPLEHLGSAELIAEVLRLEQLAADEACCFIVRG